MADMKLAHIVPIVKLAIQNRNLLKLGKIFFASVCLSSAISKQLNNLCRSTLVRTGFLLKRQLLKFLFLSVNYNIIRYFLTLITQLLISEII